MLDDEAHPHAVVPLQEWWEMPVYVTQAGGPLPPSGTASADVFLRRRDIILAAANQDGGAHVDAKLSPGYERLASPGGLGLLEGEMTLADGTTVRLPPLEDAHLVFLRQMGYEALDSFDLRLLLAIR